MMTNLLNGAHVANKLFSTIARLRLLLVMFLTLSVSAEVWAETWTWNATSPSELGSSTNNTITLNGKEWETIRSNETNQNQLQNSCIQIGSRNNPQTITLQSNAFSGKILEVSVECASYNGAHKISIQVGSTTYLSSTATPTWTTISTKTGSGTSSGQIVISFTDGSRALYIKSISVTYEEAATCTTNPTVSAGSHSNVTTTTATVSCSSGITSLGSAGCSITSYGFVYGTSSNPTISNTKVQVGTTYATTGTAFDKELTDLTANTTYYVRPYATNGNGTAYGTQTSFKTLDLPKYTVTWSVDGNTTTEEVYSGKKPTGAPTIDPNDLPCEGADKFVGWTIGEYKGNSAPGTLYPTANDIPAITDNITFYAVFADYEQ